MAAEVVQGPVGLLGLELAGPGLELEGAGVEPVGLELVDWLGAVVHVVVHLGGGPVGLELAGPGVVVHIVVHLGGGPVVLELAGPGLELELAVPGLELEPEGAGL